MFGDLKLSTGARNIHVSSLSVITGLTGVELLTFDESTESTLVAKPLIFTGLYAEDRSIVVNNDDVTALKFRTFYGLDIMDIDTTTDAFALQMYSDISFTPSMLSPNIIITPELSYALTFQTREQLDMVSFNTTRGRALLHLKLCQLPDPRPA